jgi:hypothetical protein
METRLGRSRATSHSTVIKRLGSAQKRLGGLVRRFQSRAVTVPAASSTVIVSLLHIVRTEYTRSGLMAQSSSGVAAANISRTGTSPSLNQAFHGFKWSGPMPHDRAAHVPLVTLARFISGMLLGPF